MCNLASFAIGVCNLGYNMSRFVINVQNISLYIC